MEMTKHAAKRGKQRGFSLAEIEIIINWGREVRKNRGASIYQLTKKDGAVIIQELKQTIAVIERITNSSVVLDGKQGTVITVYH